MFVLGVNVSIGSIDFGIIHAEIFHIFSFFDVLNHDGSLFYCGTAEYVIICYLSFTF